MSAFAFVFCLFPVIYGPEVNILCSKFVICSPLYVISSAFFNICSGYVLMGSQNFVAWCSLHYKASYFLLWAASNLLRSICFCMTMAFDHCEQSYCVDEQTCDDIPTMLHTKLRSQAPSSSAAILLFFSRVRS